MKLIYKTFNQIMETTGNIINIHPPQQTGQNTKQSIELQTNEGNTLQLLLFNRSNLLDGISTGDKVKALFNRKETTIKGKTFIDNYVNALIQLEQPEQTLKPQPQPTKPNQSTEQLELTFQSLRGKELLTFFHNLKETNPTLMNKFIRQKTTEQNQSLKEIGL